MSLESGLTTDISESDVGLPPFTEDDRRARPAPPDEQRQGGRAESKLDGKMDSLFLPEVIDAACENFAKFWQVSRSLVDEDLIMRRSPSLGIAGWSDPHLVVRDYGEIDRDRRAKGHHEGARPRDDRRRSVQALRPDGP